MQAADPHDAIAAQLRGLAPRRAPDAPELNETPAASPEPASEPSLRAAPLNDNAGNIRIPPPRGRSGPVVVLLAVCAGVAATMAWHSYGAEAKQRLSDLVPQLLAYAPMLQSVNAEPKDVAPQTAAAEPVTAPAPAQQGSTEPATSAPSASATPSAPAPAPAAPAAAETPPAQAALPPELMQSIEAMTREIDSLKQTVQQLQAGQQQLSQDIAKVSEHGTRHKVTAQTSKPAPRPRPRHASTPAVDSRTVARYAPPPARTYPQGAAQHDAYIPPPAPPRLPPPPGDSSAPRPPMPLQ